MQGNASEKVIINGKYANASIVFKSKTNDAYDTDFREDIYTLYIDDQEKLEFVLRRDEGFSYEVKDDTRIDGTCYRLYKFTDMRHESKSKSIKMYVQLSQEQGSIFHTLQPQLAASEDFDISDSCDS